jgi:hypothetical protein
LLKKIIKILNSSECGLVSGLSMICVSMNNYEFMTDNVVSFNLSQEDVLELLKKSSRSMHCVITPFLFIPAWRHEALLKADYYRKPDGTAADRQVIVHT